MRIPKPGDTAFLILPPEDVMRQIDKWRRVYDPNHKIVPPHITLVYPFIPENEWRQSRSMLVNCLKSFKPFNITLKELVHFEGEPTVLWIKPEDDGCIVRMHAALEKDFFEYTTGLEFAFTPHLTIGFFDSEALLVQAKIKFRQN
jgi:poly(A) polymerase